MLWKKQAKVNPNSNPDNDMSNLGNILLYMGAITKAELEAAINEQAKDKLGQVLLNLGMITQVELEFAVKKQAEMRAKGTQSSKVLYELWQMNMNKNKEAAGRKEVAINQMWKKVEQNS